MNNKLIIFGFPILLAMIYFAPGLTTAIGFGLIILPILAGLGKTKISVVQHFLPAGTANFYSRLLEVILGVVLMIVSNSVGSWKDQKEALITEKRRAAEAKAHQDQRIQQLQNSLETSIAYISKNLESSQEKYQSADFDQAEKNIQAASNRLGPFLTLAPVPPRILTLQREIKVLSAKILPIQNAKQVWEKSENLIASGDADRKDGNFLSAESKFNEAKQNISLIDESSAKARNYDIKKLSVLLDSKLREVKKPAEREQLKFEKQQRKDEAFSALCGERPEIGGWDGEVIGLERSLKSFAHDPSSIDVEDCTTPQKSDKHCWVFRCKVRGKNAFGAMVLNTPLFSKSSNGFEQLK